ncbi:hypothetical protein CVT24_005697 [Panaeolus cyanescens]|uniref:DUF1996 domain-containing protein n=1 Tax=Panaeolus cyanescens TaxID=181874 RepID=A0A409VEB7_9AGAR|nr:hypothetical protein CVT24_005697 [Panaeolus cyanescens]
MKSNLLSVAGLIALSLAPCSNAYWLMGIENVITVERLDPIVNPGGISGHAHAVVGGSNFGASINTAMLQASQCTSIPIKEDKSNYWYPQLYFQWRNGSFSSLSGGPVIYYLFDDKPGTTTAFPRDFRMLSGTPSLRTYDPNSFAQKAVDHLCLDFERGTTHFDALPDRKCASGIRSQINFPSCWDGKNLDSPDHKSHVAFKSNGPDSGTCNDPNFPITLPRIFLEVYWYTADFDKVRDQAMNPDQPYVYAHGDPTGYGNHADFFNGWDDGVLQRAVDGCTCSAAGDPQCCADKGIFTLRKGEKCFITPSLDEPTTGTLPKLPGNNPVQPAGRTAIMYPDTVQPAKISPVYAYTGSRPTATGNVIGSPVTVGAPSSPPPAPTSSTPSSSPASSSSPAPSTADASPTNVPSSSSAAPVTNSPTPAPPPPSSSAPPPPPTSAPSPAASSSSPPNPYPTVGNPPRPPAGGYPPPASFPRPSGTKPPVLVAPPAYPTSSKPAASPVTTPVKQSSLPVHHPDRICPTGRRHSKSRLSKQYHDHHKRRSGFESDMF